jgi:hypothetical protein
MTTANHSSDVGRAGSASAGQLAEHAVEEEW